MGKGSIHIYIHKIYQIIATKIFLATLFIKGELERERNRIGYSSYGMFI